MSPPSGSRGPFRRVVAIAGDSGLGRVTLAAWLALLTVVGVSRLPQVPEALSVPAWPALAAAFLTDAALFNEAGVAVGDAGFWTLAVLGCYVEALAIVTAARAIGRSGESDA